MNKNMNKSRVTKKSISVICMDSFIVKHALVRRTESNIISEYDTVERKSAEYEFFSKESIGTPTRERGK